MSSGSHRDLPGHIRKTYRSIERYVPVVDIIVELLDARMPESSRFPTLLQRLRRPSVIILGKADLADPKISASWTQYFTARNIPCLELDCRKANLSKRLKDVIENIPRAVGLQRKVRRLMVLGIPNVGKSTLINTLAGRRAAKTADKPGVTRDIQWIKLPGFLELLDLPGILDYSLLNRGDDLRLINSLPGPTDDPMVPAERLFSLLAQTGQQACLPGSSATEITFADFLSHYARQRHFLQRGGHPDLHRAAVDFLRRFQQAGFGRISLETPEKLYG